MHRATRIVIATVLAACGGGGPPAGSPDAPPLPTTPDAAAAHAAGEAAVRRRHADLHAGDDDRLLDRPANATIYGYGYLHQADTLCYWRRERAEIATVIDGDPTIPPTCTL